MRIEKSRNEISKRRLSANVKLEKLKILLYRERERGGIYPLTSAIYTVCVAGSRGNPGQSA